MFYTTLAARGEKSKEEGKRAREQQYERRRRKVIKIEKYTRGYEICNSMVLREGASEPEGTERKWKREEKGEMGRCHQLQSLSVMRFFSHTGKKP